MVLVRGKELRKLVIIALLQVFTEGKHILYAHPHHEPHSLPANSPLLDLVRLRTIPPSPPPLLPAGTVS